ncbi:MAG TPA: sugar ABC transporter substrate-binding protein [Gryllotalpicola sp.]
MAKKSVMLVGAALTATAVAVALSGCGSNNAGGGSGGSGTTITYLSSQQGPSVTATATDLKPVIAKFTKQTGIKVNVQVADWNSLQTKINTSISAGTGPDVMNIGNTWGPSYQAGGAFTEFTGKNADAIGGLDKFATTALNAGSQADKTSSPASVPLFGLAYGLYYNKALFKEAGIATPPTTWEEMVADAKKITALGNGKWGIAIAGNNYTESIHFAFLTAAQNGGDWYKGEKPTFTSDANVQGVQRYLDLMGTDKVVNPADAQNNDTGAALVELAQGKAGMVLAQIADSTLTSNGMKQGDWGVTYLPWPEGTPKENQISTFPAGINIAIPKYSKNQSAALKFVKFMTSEEAQNDLDKPFTSLPVLKDATPTFTSDTEEAKVFSTAYNTQAKVLPQVKTEGDFETSVGKAIGGLIQQIASGKKVTTAQIKAALADAQAQVEALG